MLRFNKKDLSRFPLLLFEESLSLKNNLNKIEALAYY